MSCSTGQTKFIGSAAAVVSYYAEESNDPVLQAVLGYYSTPKDGVVFQHVAGKATAHLPGLDLSLGLTREQHADLHNGRWDGQQLTKGNYAHVFETDERGRRIKAENPNTGKWELVPVLEPVVDDNGEPVLDELTGQPKTKIKTESQTVAGFDVTFALDKSWSEFLIEHPEHVELVRANFLKAVDAAMSWTEANAEVIITKDGGKKEQHTAEMVWWTVIGNSSRPSKETIDRGYGGDPHLHAHSFLSASAYFGPKGWRKIDPRQIWQTAELRGMVCSLEMNRLMEDAGLRIDYTQDRKGRYFSQIAGSNERARDFFSTQRNRMYDLMWQFEREHGRKPTQVELKLLKNMTKLHKTKESEAADELGNLEQVERWRAALDAAGIELTIADIGAQVERPRDVKQELFRRLESPGGVGRDIQAAAVFGPEVVYPTVIRSAEGLGYNIDDLEQLANEYIANELVVMRDAVDPQHRLYTTKTILRGEEVIAERLEQMAGRSFKAVPEHVLAAEMRAGSYSLDPDQERAYRAMCSESGLVHITGSAGAGKTDLQKRGVSALRKAGLVDEVIVVAVARKRAKETGESVGADKAWSVEALERAVQSGWKPGQKSLVIFDEIAMANTFDMATTLDAIQGARLVTVGDSKQAQAIGAGGWYEAELAKRGSIQLTRNYRQQNHKDVEAWTLLREGDGHGCVANLHERKRIYVAEHREDLVTEVQARYEHYLDKGLDPSQIGIVVTGSNAEVLDPANRMVQRVLIDRGVIDELTAYTVVEQSTGRIWKLHAGDRVIWNRGTWFADKSIEPVLNGTTGVIQQLDFDGRARVQLDTEDRRTLTVQLAKEADVQPIGVGYAMSQAKWQGGEIDVALCLPGNPNISDLNAGYSSTTRGRDVTEIIIDGDSFGEFPLRRLGESWSTESPKTQASEYLAMFQDYERELEAESKAVTDRVQALAQIEETQQTLNQSRGIGL